MSRLKLFTIFAVTLAVICILPAARATQYNLSYDSCTSGCFANGTTSGGTVDVVQGSGSSVTITVNLASGFNFQENPGGPGNQTMSFVFNVDISSGLSISGLPAGWVQNGDTTSGSLQSDGLGTFDYGVACTTSLCNGTTNPSSVSFTVTNTNVGGTLHPSDFAVLSTGGSGPIKGVEQDYYFGADVIGNNGGKTGFIGAPNPGTDVTPEASSILFFGTGLLVAGWVLRKKFSSVW